MLENLCKVKFYNSLDSLPDVWPELDNFCFQRSHLLPVFGTLQDFTIKALNMIQQRPPQVQKTKLNEEESVVMRLDSHSALTPSYRNRSLVFTAAGWPN